VELPERETCYRALQRLDSRFDGLLFVGVTSTGIYCRPVCPARTARIENCRFFGSAAAAQEAGFRPCLSCRCGNRARSGFRARNFKHSFSRTYVDCGWCAWRRRRERRSACRPPRRRPTSPSASFRSASGRLSDRGGATRRVLFAKQLIHEQKCP
jgi:AraC family transcriptional regulator of adaptative response / DNA-3-methyladenine glycosylase II